MTAEDTATRSLPRRGVLNWFLGRKEDQDMLRRHCARGEADRFAGFHRRRAGETHGG